MFSIIGWAIASGSSPASLCAIPATGEPWASIPTASITASGPRPSVISRIVPGRSSWSSRSSTSMPRPRTRSSRSGTRSTPITRLPRWGAIRVAMSPIGPRPSTTSVPPSGTSAYCDALPRGRQHVGEEHEAVVGRPLGHLDRQEVAERHPQELGLAAGHLPVELGVAEQRGAGAVLVDLRRLALRVQVVAAHPAVAAGDVERDHDAVADERGDLRADLLDDPHRLVAEHVAGVQERRQHGVEVQVGSAQPGRGDADDDVGGVLDRGVRNLVDADVADALPCQCFHSRSLPGRGRVNGCGASRSSS